MQTLREKGIGTQVHYIPVHRQPYYVERYGKVALPGADAYYARCLYFDFSGHEGRRRRACGRSAGRTGEAVTTASSSRLALVRRGCPEK